MQTLKFSYYDEFACTGPECDDSCCKHWLIYLTKREYLNFKKMDCSPQLKAVINSAFKKEKHGDDQRYALMDLREDGSCPFLGEDRLCMMQKEKGESVLTVVCSTFPRHWRKVGRDVIAFSLTPTCYHVVELLMKHPEGISLAEGEYDGKNKWINRGAWTGGILSENAGTLPYIWSIKTAQLDILQNREFTISERLLILGYYTKKACEYLKDSPEKLGQLGAMMLDSELCRKIADSLKTPQNDIQAMSKSNDMLFKMVIEVRTKAPDHRITRIMNVIADSVELEYEPKDDGTYNVSCSIEACTKNLELYRKIEEERPYIIENLLASLAFAAFSADEDALWADYFSLAVLYNFFKIGIAAFLPESYTDKELAMAFTNIVKILLNAGIAKDKVMQDFAKNGKNSLSYVAFLIS